ncbi:MAG TPA: ABC transporter permease [Cyclobacteriaceae bacterium]|nr:ABC transporter permease [Cyclobacteriaceae bacterium]
MLLNYLKLSFRLLLRNPFLTLINITGLSIGFAAFYILWPYAQSELRADQFYKDYGRMARLSRLYEFNEGNRERSVRIAAHNSGLSKKFADEYDEIEEVTRIVPQQFFETYRHGFGSDVFVSIDVRDGEREYFRETKLVYGDPNFFTFFSLPVVTGNPENFLAAPNTAVLSEATAARYFGDSDPLLKTIYFNDSIAFTVTGVYKNFPHNTHLGFDLMLSTAGIDGIDMTGWFTTWFGSAYIKVKEGVDFTDLQYKINLRADEIYGICPNCPGNSKTTAVIEPINEVPFTPVAGNTFVEKSRPLLISIELLAFVILFLAWVNSASLSVYQLRKRMYEIGTRKAVGAQQRDIITQFLVEAIMINLLSFILGLTMIQLFQRPIEMWLNFYIIEVTSLPVKALVVMMLTFVSGIFITVLYPIVILRMKAVLLLKKHFKVKAPLWINIVVTAQYGSALILLAWIGIVYFQLDLIISKPLGVQTTGMVVVDCPLKQTEDFESKLDVFLKEARKVSGVEDLTTSKTVIGDVALYGIPIQRNKNDIEWGFDTNGGVDENFLETFGIPILHGRNFQPDMPSDRNAILVSKDATTRMGFKRPDDAIGAKVILPWYHHDNVEIIGVYRDYEFRPFLSDLVDPNRGSFISYKTHLMSDYYPSKISIRIKMEAAATTISDIGKVFEDVFPRNIYKWSFVDENVMQYYQGERTARNQITVFTLVAVGIACLGLLGMITNKTVEKTKEIGIRKILGARLLQISQILLSNTARQLAMAAMVAIPLAYLLASRYLEKFSERITLQWWHFVFPVLLLIAIMAVTIAAVVWKAAKSNPVDALKHE